MPPAGQRYRYCAECGRRLGGVHGSTLLCPRCANDPERARRQLLQAARRQEWLDRLDASITLWQGHLARERTQ